MKSNIVRRLVYSYWRLLLSCAEWVLIGVGIVLLAAGIVFPIWFVATRFTAVYTGVLLVLVGILLLTLFVMRLVRHTRHQRRGQRKRHLLVRLGVVLGLPILLYALLLLYQRQLYLPAVLVLILLLLILGLWNANRLARRNR